MATRIHRVTLFKIPDPENQNKLLEAYKVLARDQSKGGKPYITYMCAGRALEDDRAKGYTVVAKTEFETLADMRFYDKDCAAHAALRKTVATLGAAEPPLSAYFEGQPTIASA